jgi:hypothetical protein
MRIKFRNDADRAMETARLAWAKSRAKDLGRSEDDPQIDVLGVVPWSAAFPAGIKYALENLYEGDALKHQEESHAKVVSELKDQIRELQYQLSLFKESRLDIEFDLTHQMHAAQFLFSEYLVKADPSIDALAKTIAERIRSYISKQKEPGLTKDRALSNSEIQDDQPLNGSSL